MCLSNRAVERQCDSAAVLKFFIFVVTLLFFCTIESVTNAIAHAESLKVSLLLGDTHTKTAAETVKAVKADGIDDIHTHVYPLKDVRGTDLSHLRDSKLIIINIMGRQIVAAVKTELGYAIKKRCKGLCCGSKWLI